MTQSTGRFKIYSASAGSGKTFMLTVEYLRFALQNPKYTFKKILAITFTNKATSEMKSRILEACQAFSGRGDKPLDGRNLALWERVLEVTGYEEEELMKRSKELYTQILHNYSDFSISTIDSFTQRVLRSFAYELQIPLNFETSLETEEVLKVVADRLIAKVGTDDEEGKNITQLLEEIAMQSLEDFDKYDIRKDIKESAKIIADDKSMVYAEKLSKISTQEFQDIGKKLMLEDRRIKKEMTERALQSLALLNTVEIPLSDYSFGYSGWVGSFLKIRSRNFDKCIGARFIAAMNDDKFISGAKDKKHLHPIFEPIKNEIIELGHPLIALDERLRVINFIYKNFNKLATLNYLNDIYKRYRHEEDIVLIGEFNQLISREVKNQPAPFIFEKLGEQYEYYLIDEFQDTSVMQFHNILPLITHSLSDEKQQGESLVVGDGKQAIYRFNGGEIHQLSTLPELMHKGDDLVLHEHEGILRQHAQKLNLEYNYRSKEEIVKFNNLLFNYIHDVGSYQNFYSVYEDTSQQIAKQDSGGYVEINLTHESGNKEEFVSERIEYVVERIQSIKEDYPYDKMAILCKTKKELFKIAQALGALEIPVASSESLLLKNDISICLFPLFYKHILKPDDNIIKLEIATKLKWLDLITISDHDLISQAGTCENFIAWLKEISVIDIDKLTDLSLIEAWDLYGSWVPIKHVSPLFHGFFKEFLYDFTQSQGNDYDHFTLWWDEKRDKLSAISSDTMEGIQLSTMHKAKGLEYEVVILPFADWTWETKDAEWINIEEELIKPIDFIYANTSSSQDFLDDIYADKIEKNTLDALNLLYVACTRAVSELYIFCKKKDWCKDAIVEKKSLLEFVNNAIIGIPEIDNSGDFISFGNKTKPSTKEDAKTTPLIINYETGKKANISIKDRSSTIWNHEITDRIAHGNLIHKLLEKIRTPDDIHHQVNQALTYGWIEKEDREDIEKQIIKIVNHEDVAEFFGNETEVRAEAAIIDPSGHTYIPDRLSFKDKEVKILDFKSGQKSSKHKKQLDQYANLLTQMNYSVTEKIIVYIEPLEIIKITD